MERFDGTIDGTSTAGRKGIAYDWQSLYAEAQLARLESQLAAVGTERQLEFAE